MPEISISYIKGFLSVCFIIAVFAAVPAGLLVYDNIQNQKLNNIKAEDYFTVESLVVSDFYVDTEKTIIYKRKVLKAFDGEWAVKVVVVDVDGEEKGFNICNNNAKVHYLPTNVIPKTGVSLRWFIEKQCNLKPGKYYLHTTWFLYLVHESKKVTRKITKTSNVFEVKGRS